MYSKMKVTGMRQIVQAIADEENRNLQRQVSFIANICFISDIMTTHCFLAR
jgi:hypothetical protein